jgi:predicted glycogen debranching enzyme
MNFDLSREWLETNGIGGYACGTLLNCNTRRYHALLCAAARPPLGRFVLVNKADETLIVNGRRFELGCNQFPDAVAPRGYEYLKAFHCDPLPTWIYEILPQQSGLARTIQLQKDLWMPHGCNQTVLRYTLRGAEVGLADSETLALRVRVFVTGRDYHHLHHRNADFNSQLSFGKNEAGDDELRIKPYEQCPPIHCRYNGAFEADGYWYEKFQYAVERERGLDCEEDYWTPGEFVYDLSTLRSAHLTLSSEPLCITGSKNLDDAHTKQEEVGRRAALTQQLPVLPPEYSRHVARLAVAADQFIVRRAKDQLHTIIAGYPWFSDWGRDTMIALPGLCLTTNRTDEAASILLNFSKYVSQGMIPNRFPDVGEEPDYNTFDATLWFFHAVAEYYKKTNDTKTLRAIYPALVECLHWHLKGTRFGIQADPEDGLLRGGSDNSQLTWMDAKVGETAFTPRIGKPVEIQALWFNALCELSSFAALFEDAATKAVCDEWSAKVHEHFATRFWNEEAQCLFDCIDGDHKDAAVRPNQIFAVSLPHALLGNAQAHAVVEVVQRELLTPFGLRSLSPRDPQYRGEYLGDAWSRDSAYHQGTVWTWPLGGFLTAYLKVHEYSPSAKRQVQQWLEPLAAHLDEACIGSINEIFDGDAPHTPRGCFAQAWSVSEVLRVWVDELSKTS